MLMFLPQISRISQNYVSKIIQFLLNNYLCNLRNLWLFSFGMYEVDLYVCRGSH